MESFGRGEGVKLEVEERRKHESIMEMPGINQFYVHVDD